MQGEGGVIVTVSMSTLNRLVPISLFNQGKAAKVFSRLKDARQLVVMKNNVPAAIMLSPDEYERLSQIAENYQLLLMAQARLQNNNLSNAVSEQAVMASLGISAADINNAEELEIE
jgi:antitoxin StbD